MKSNPVNRSSTRFHLFYMFSLSMIYHYNKISIASHLWIWVIEWSSAPQRLKTKLSTKILYSWGWKNYKYFIYLNYKVLRIYVVNLIIKAFRFLSNIHIFNFIFLILDDNAFVTLWTTVDKNDKCNHLKLSNKKIKNAHGCFLMKKQTSYKKIISCVENIDM